jgi:hypothetical protein
MPAVHYYLGRPARVWISAHSRRSPARQARNGSGRVHSGIPGQPGGLLARQRIAIARFGADVAAAGGIGPALAAGLEPADYPVVPGGVPQAWERAQVYLGLCERYQELYRAQVAELHLLMATAPGCSLPLSHRRPPTHPLTNTHTGYISPISGAARRSDAYDPPVMYIGGSGAREVTVRETRGPGRRSRMSALTGGDRQARLPWRGQGSAALATGMTAACQERRRIMGIWAGSLGQSSARSSPSGLPSRPQAGSSPRSRRLSSSG